MPPFADVAGACQSCFTPFRPMDLNVLSGTATCAACKTVNTLERARRAPVPARFSVTEQQGRVLFSWRWRTRATLALIPFCAAWDAFLVFWYGVALGTTSASWWMLVMPAAHLLVGAALTASLVANLFNSTSVELSAGWLRVRNGPVPWRRDVALPASEISELFFDESTNAIVAGLRDGRTVSLVGGLADEAEAAYLIEALERRTRGAAPVVQWAPMRHGLTAVADTR